MKKLFKNPRIIILIITLLLAIFAIQPVFDDSGVAIRSVAKDSAAEKAGIQSPTAEINPVNREVILTINNQPVESVAGYYEMVDDLQINETVQLKTDQGFYRLTVQPEIEVIELNETEMRLINETVLVNKTVNGSQVEVEEIQEVEREVPKTIENVLGPEDLGIRVYERPTSNIRKGLELQGGTRVILEPEEEISSSDMEILLENMQQRLNVFGLSDVIVRKTQDLAGNQFILVEVAGANEEEVRDLVARQGKFEAKIGESTVFRGGQDITYVCRSAQCSGIDSYSGGCQQQSAQQWVCPYFFSITLSQDAAQRQAAITQDVPVVTESGQPVLEDQLDLYLDDELRDSLNINADLKGRPVTNIQITGSGSGVSQESAVENALDDMKRMQTILITGSLPVKLNVVKTDTISSALGDEFTRNALLIGVFAILAVGVVIFIKHRRLTISIPMMLTMLSEIILMLGLAALIRWNLDLAAIAGIIIAAGTGVDDQIVIVDEVLRGKAKENWKEKLKNAFFIIFAAYFTTLVAMVPLLFAGAGLLKGFAFTTIAGVTFGVFITRPAFAAMMEHLLK